MSEQPVGALFPDMSSINKAADAVAKLANNVSGLVDQIRTTGLTVTMPGATVTIKVG